MKRVKIILVHGIHTSRKPATSQLAPCIREYFVERGIEVDIEIHRYGYALALPRFIGDWLNEKRAATLAKRVPADGITVVVGHSNGCTIAHILQKLHRRLAGIVLFQPALDNDVAFTGADHALVVYNERDDVVEQSRLARFSSWGNMGRVGYRGPSANVRQVDAMNPQPIPPLPYSGHCGFVENGKAVTRSWGREVGRWIEETIIRQEEAAHG